jgi:hypothetical protein
MHAIARMSAGGMTRNPRRRNVDIVTAWRSRRSAVNQRMVASEPVTDRFGFPLSRGRQYLTLIGD